MFDKSELKRELIARLREDLATAEAAHRATVEGATHPEAKSEGDKDTRAIEQQYLARGQAERVVSLRTQIAEVEAMELHPVTKSHTVALGTLVQATGESGLHTYFLVPSGGFTLRSGAVQVLSIHSPMGRSFIGAAVGEEVELELGKQIRTYEIVAIE
ncbi:MAG: GreA/GreB family elongation factor [Polyangiaceae bacterium]|nr:GreA/GreB family elongation factor [Polyangiaceae bacterium]